MTQAAPQNGSRARVDLVRPKMRRSIWCEGCGLGNLEEALTRALVHHVARRLGADPKTPEGLERVKNGVAMVSGIGCTSRMPGHLDLNTLHTTHGRSLAFASGLKMARPDLTVLLAAGDGDIFAIGGNHFIHAARRNLDLTLVVYDNESYGMTGSQYSPTSPMGELGSSAPYGVFEPPFDLVSLALGAGASFVAQGAVTTLQEHQEQLEELIAQALEHKGFSFVNVRGTCHTGWGSFNKRSDAFRYRRYIEERTLPVERWRELPEGERPKHIPLGLIHCSDRPDIQSSPAYQSVVARAGGAPVVEPLEPLRLAALEPLSPRPRTAIRFAGSGGQGVISAGEIALSCALQAGQQGVFTKNYGPEARGGEAYSDLIVSDGEIYFPQAHELDVLVALNQQSFDKFRAAVRADGRILVNGTAVTETYRDPRVVVSPIGEILGREVRPPRRELGINVLALAVALEFLEIVPRAALQAAVMQSVGKKNPTLNRRALEAGAREVERLKVVGRATHAGTPALDGAH
ncbi:MAG: 2-oxoacid:acceptor oxidoreductase family protein [Deltaproteobacteria bacterium]|nr:2-oxoacid:acceptor oxidoreductase family protein [Deltaproteobacteria bacterium]